MSINEQEGGMSIADWRKLLMLDCITGHLIWTCGRGAATPGNRAGCVWNTGYRMIRRGSKLYFEHRIVWALLHGRWPTLIDHINGIKDDNRPCNLREATQSQNGFNKGITPLNTTGFKGVTRSKTGRFMAKITAHKNVMHLGTFNTAQEAHAAYAEAARIHHGEFARV